MSVACGATTATPEPRLTSRATCTRCRSRRTPTGKTSSPSNPSCTTTYAVSPTSSTSRADSFSTARSRSFAGTDSSISGCLGAQQHAARRLPRARRKRRAPRRDRSLVPARGCGRSARIRREPQRVRPSHHHPLTVHDASCLRSRASGDEQGRDSICMWDLLPLFRGFATRPFAGLFLVAEALASCAAPSN
jgi:hypothetical protein